MQDRIENIAAACGVSAADVELFARFTATQIDRGLELAEAIKAASVTMQQLCNRAFASISAHNPTNPFGHRDQFLPVVYELLTA